VKTNHKYVYRAELRANIDLALLSIATAAIFFFAGVNQEFLKNYPLFTAQVAACIPLLLAATLSASRTLESINPNLFWQFGRVCYIVGYGLLINGLGILLSVLSFKSIALLFIGLNIIVTGLYSFISIWKDHHTVRTRLWRDGLYILTVALGGLIPILLM
jgi:hypothetical protein